MSKNSDTPKLFEIYVVNDLTDPAYYVGSAWGDSSHKGKVRAERRFLKHLEKVGGASLLTQRVELGNELTLEILESSVGTLREAHEAEERWIHKMLTDDPRPILNQNLTPTGPWRSVRPRTICIVQCGSCPRVTMDGGLATHQKAYSHEGRIVIAEISREEYNANKEKYETPISEVQKLEIVQAIQNGATIVDLMLEYGIPKVRITAIRKEWNDQHPAELPIQRPPSNKLIPLHEEFEVVHRYESGESMAQVGKHYGVSDNSVAEILRKHGVKSRPSTKGYKVFTAEQVEVFIREWESGLPVTAIAHSYGEHPHTIAHFLENLGYVITPRRRDDRPLFQCGDCDKTTTGGGLSTHHRLTGHTGKTFVKRATKREPK